MDPKSSHDARIDVRFSQVGDADAIEMTLERNGREIESMTEPLATNEAAQQAALDQLVTRVTLSPRLAFLDPGTSAEM